MKSADKPVPVAIRVSPGTLEILEISALMRDTKSMQELLHPLIEDFAKREASEPEIKDVLRLKREYAARADGSVARLPASSEEKRLGS